MSNRKVEPQGEACGSCGSWRRRTQRGDLFRCRNSTCAPEDKTCTALSECDRIPDGKNGSICTGHAGQRRKGKPFTPLRSKRSSEMLTIRDADGRKRCVDCNEWLPESDFNPSKTFSDKLFVYCRKCQTLRRTEGAYGLRPGQYAEILESQGGGCAICGTPPPENQRLAVDHDHDCCPQKKRSCGKCVRGLLCGPCNVALGMLREDPRLFERALSYLSRST